MDAETAAALIFSATTLIVVAFQFGLALGAPWGAYAMGGAFPGRYPPRMRVAAVVQAGVLLLLAAIELASANVLLPSIAAPLRWTVWLPVVVSALGVVLNAISPSAGERRIWVPVTLVLLVSSLIVAIAA
ncbi:MAG: hypothetical protein ABI534_05785 [Chloroflexota bacterium]